MERFTLLKANIRHQKSSFIGIIILMFFVSLALTTVFTIYLNSGSRDEQALKEDGYGYMVIQLFSEKVPGGNIPALLDKIQENKNVDSIKTVPAVYSQIAELNGHTSGTVILQPDKQDCFKFQVFNEKGNGFLKHTQDLKQGEVSVPFSFQSLYDCKIGDRITFKTEGQSKEYTVKYFMEDPFCGSSMMGIKNVLMNNTDLEQLYQKAHGSKEISQGTILNIFKSSSSDLNYMKFERSINENSDVGGYARGSMGMDQSKGYMLLTTNIFCGILVSFIILLLMVAIIVMNHSITTSIDLEYVNLGILKAVGFSQGKLKTIFLVQYLCSALIGSLIGIPVAIPIINYVNRLTTPVTGLLVSSRLALLPCLGVIFCILIMITLFVYVKLRKIATITPVEAIRGGREGIYFSNRFEVRIRKKCMNILLAFRQLTSNHKQYVSSAMITILLVFFLVIVSNMGSWVGKDGNGLIQLFACIDSDIEVNYKDTDGQKVVERIIASGSEVSNSYQTASSYLLINGCKVFSFMCSDPQQYNTVLEGRTCRYDNEILITKFIASELKLNIGDKVTLSSGGKKGVYMVSGIYQSAIDLGKNIALNKEGYEKLVDQVDLFYEYKLSDGTKAGLIMDDIKRTYGDRIMVQIPADDIGGIASIVTAINGILLLVYMISIIFVVIVIFLQCGKIFAKERQDYGIYKALGFTSSSLRLQFSLRFLLVSGISGLVGAVGSILLMDSCMGFLLSFMGISKFTGSVTAMAVLAPVIFMVLVFFVFSYLLSSRIKRVEARILISE